MKLHKETMNWSKWNIHLNKKNNISFLKQREFFKNQDVMLVQGKDSSHKES